MNLKALLLFGMLTLKGASALGGVFDIAVLFDLAIVDMDENGTVTEYATCSQQESQKIEKMVDDAMVAIELVAQQGNEKHWLSFMEFATADSFTQVGKGNRELALNGELEEDITEGNRELAHVCNSFCRYMCMSVGTYCKCCSCCGSARRRQLRSLEVRLLDNSPENLDKMETAMEDAVYEFLINADAAEAVQDELESANKHIACLADPYAVEVRLHPQEEDLTWEKRQAEIEEIRTKHKGDRRGARRTLKRAKKRFNRVQMQFSKVITRLSERQRDVQIAELVLGHITDQEMVTAVLAEKEAKAKAAEVSKAEEEAQKAAEEAAKHAVKVNEHLAKAIEKADDGDATNASKEAEEAAKDVVSVTQWATKAQEEAAIAGTDAAKVAAQEAQMSLTAATNASVQATQVAAAAQDSSED